MKYAALVIAGLALAGCADGTTPAIPVLTQPAPSLNGLINGVNRTLPIGLSLAEESRFRQAVDNAGCVITTPEQAASVKAQSGLTDDKLRLATQFNTETGGIVPVANGYRLTTGRCANV